MFIYDDSFDASASLSLTDDCTAAELVTSPSSTTATVRLDAHALRGLATEALAMADEIDTTTIAAEVAAAATTEDAAELADPDRFCRTCGLYHSAAEAAEAARLGRCPRWAPEDAAPAVYPWDDPAEDARAAAGPVSVDKHWTGLAHWMAAAPPSLDPEDGQRVTRSYHRRVTGAFLTAGHGASTGFITYLELAELRTITTGELPWQHEPAPRQADPVAEHAAEHVTRFRRQWGADPTSALAVGLTRQQQAPRPEYPACDQLWAYHAMTVLRSVGRQS